MTTAIVLLAVAALAATGWMVARARARSLYSGRGSLHSMPVYHGWHLVLWTALPALIAFAVWSSVSPPLVEQAVLADPAAAALPASEMERSAILAEARVLAGDPAAPAFHDQSCSMAEATRAAQTRFGLIGALLVLVTAFSGAAYGYTRVTARFPARTSTPP